MPEKRKAKASSKSKTKAKRKSPGKSTISSTRKPVTKSTKKNTTTSTKKPVTKSTKKSTITSTKKPVTKSTKKTTTSSTKKSIRRPATKSTLTPRQKSAVSRKAKDVDLRKLYQDLAKKLGGTYKPPNLFPGQPYPIVEAETGKWTITYDMGDQKGVKHTKISAPYNYAKTIIFLICKGGDCFVPDNDNPLATTGDPKFDSEFTEDTTDPRKFKELFADKSVRLRLRSFIRMNLRMEKLGKNSEMYFWIFSHVTDMDALVEFHDLLVILLDRTYQLCYPDQKLAAKDTRA